jgi:hypothetical protein
MITIKNQQGVGYSGKLDNKAYLARITGVDERFGLQREFLTADKVERDSFTKPKYVRTFFYYVSTLGLYEESSQGERQYIMITHGVPKIPDGTEDAEGKRLLRTVISSDRADKIARLLTEGVSFDDARLRTKAPK